MKKSRREFFKGHDGPTNDPELLAEEVSLARCELDVTLESDKRRWPKDSFDRFVNAVMRYSEVMEGSQLIHRSVAAEVSGAREYLELQGNRVPGSALAEADRLEVILFSGYDPHFEGPEPPGY